MQQPAETTIISTQQNFDAYCWVNPVKMEFEDDRVIKILKKHKNARYKLTLLGFLFPASVKNNTEQIFITCIELSDVKKYLISGKIQGLLGIIHHNKINNCKERIKGQSVWINTTLEE